MIRIDLSDHHLHTNKPLDWSNNGGDDLQCFTRSYRDAGHLTCSGDKYFIEKYFWVEDNNNVCSHSPREDLIQERNTIYNEHLETIQIRNRCNGYKK